jgi:16S rRNA (guanine527-N7)-methyltransferase
MDILTKYFKNLSDQQIQQFGDLKDLYAIWNQRINVISRKDLDNFYIRHVLHSLSIAAHFDFPAGYEIMDLGTGGGFPGIPLAIMFPEVHFHLTDSINKKLKVVNEVSTAIGLRNVTVQHTRAEEIKDKKFDVVVSRAVAPLKDLWNWSKPLLRKGPLDHPEKISGLICLKGGDLKNEISKSGCHPKAWEIFKIFEEDFFKEKYMLHVTP